MKPFVFPAILILFAVAGLAQSPQTGVLAQPNTISAAADGKFESAPDTALLQFNLAVQEDTSDGAFRHASQAAERLRAVLRQNGIDPKSAEIGYYSLQPVVDYRNPKHKVIGYRVTSAVTLKLKNFEKVGPLTEGLSGIEETQGESVSYTLEDFEAAKQKAVADAFNKAREVAETLARAGTRTLGELLYASIDVAQPVGILRPMNARIMADAAQAQVLAAPTEAFSEQKIQITARVQAVFSLR